MQAGCLGAAATEADAGVEAACEALRTGVPSRDTVRGLSRRRERPAKDAAAEGPMGEASRASPAASDAQSIRL